MIRPTSPPVHVRRIEEIFEPGNPGYWVHPDWAARFPWLVQGTTGRSRGDGEVEGGGRADFAFFTDPPAPGARDSWEGLGERLGFDVIVHSRQLHGQEILVHGGETLVHGLEGHERMPAGGARLTLGPDADGHATGSKGVLLGVTVADCVPVFLVDPGERIVGLLHAGWRGAVAGILERGVELLGDEFGSLPEDIHLHLGPAICGECYGVGPEVHLALGLPEPGEPSPVDLRGHLTSRAMAAGIGEGRITESAWCTLCEGSPFFSHRRGESGRQVGFLGIRPQDRPSDRPSDRASGASPQISPSPLL